MAASASSGLPLSFVVDSSTPVYPTPGSRTVCSVGANGKLTIDLVGTCVIMASQNGNDAQGAPTYYAPATPQTATITVLASDPSEVQSVIAQSANQSLALNWSAPVHDGGAPITNYLITWYPSATPGIGGGTATTSASTTTYVISSLTNGVLYTATVQAVNAAGLIGP